MAILHLIINLYSMHRLIPDWYLSKRERVYCAFIDYKKAFDLVDRTSLWRKLLKNYVDGNFFRVINHGWCRTLLLLLLQLFAMAWTQQLWPLIRWRSSATLFIGDPDVIRTRKLLIVGPKKLLAHFSPWMTGISSPQTPTTDTENGSPDLSCHGSEPEATTFQIPQRATSSNMLQGRCKDSLPSS